MCRPEGGTEALGGGAASLPALSGKEHGVQCLCVRNNWLIKWSPKNLPNRTFVARGQGAQFDVFVF